MSERPRSSSAFARYAAVFLFGAVAGALVDRVAVLETLPPEVLNAPIPADKDRCGWWSLCNFFPANAPKPNGPR